MGKCLIGFLVVISGFANIASADLPRRDVFINVNDVFIPDGQTSDKDAIAVVSGTFPNSCYSMKAAEVTNVSSTEQLAKLKATVTGGMCLMVIVPYSKQLNLGRLSPGEHTLKFINGDDTSFEKVFTIL